MSADIRGLLANPSHSSVIVATENLHHCYGE
jgi:hypothetical protein